MINPITISHWFASLSSLKNRRTPRSHQRSGSPRYGKSLRRDLLNWCHTRSRSRPVRWALRLSSWETSARATMHLGGSVARRSLSQIHPRSQGRARAQSESTEKSCRRLNLTKRSRWPQ